VGRLSFATTEERLKKEFECIGSIDTVRLVKDNKGKSRGYAFVTFKHESDANWAIQKWDGRRVDGRRILVDREMGRTSTRWLPRCLGGGKGGESRRTENDYIVKEVQREFRREQEDQKEERVQRDEQPETNGKSKDDLKIEKHQSSTNQTNAINGNEEREPGELWNETN